MTPREFLLKKFPTNKYFDCPVPKQYWEVMQEYAEAYNKDKQSELLCSFITFYNAKPKVKKGELLSIGDIREFLE